MQKTKTPKKRGVKSDFSKNNSRRNTRSDKRSSRDRSRSNGQNRGRSSRRGRVMPTFDPTQFINRNPIPLKEEVYQAKHKFADFEIDRRLVKTIKDMGIQSPSPIQDQVIPLALLGNDIVGLAETGTGKTAAFLIPVIERTKANFKGQTLILTPTRELALQVESELKKLTKNFRFYSTVCVGGTPIRPQINQLRKPNQFIIGTPGRIKDLIERGNLKTSTISTVVLDEADRMLDMGFIHDIREILSGTPEHRQTLFFSATMDDRTKALINDFMQDPTIISVKKTDVISSIAQDVVSYDKDQKFQTLIDLMSNNELERVIIFGAMKHSVEKLSNELNSQNIKSESIHGNKSHGQRQRSLSRFKSGNARVLVATDVAARGIHVDNVTHVINYDLPNTFEDYVHRIGRTGRGKKKGIALTFVSN